LGAEFKAGSRGSYFLSFRLHHISNGGIDDENRGVNSALLLFGRFY
jgi:lipid A 3-O-deacylase